MDWRHPYLLLLVLPVLGLLLLFDARSRHPMPAGRRRVLLIVRSAMALSIVVALAAPSWIVRSNDQAVVFVLDHSMSLGDGGWRRILSAYRELHSNLPPGTLAGVVTAGRQGRLLAAPGQSPKLDADPGEEERSATDLERAVTLASAVFPAGKSKHVVLLTDGLETAGDLNARARDAALGGIRIHALPVAGDRRPDVRILRLAASQPRIHEGATVELAADVEASVNGSGVLRLFENGIEIDRQEVAIDAGQTRTLNFRRSPESRNIFHYRAVLEGFDADSILQNNEALAVVDVRGKPLVLHIEGEPGEARYLAAAMAKEGIRLDARSPSAMPANARELAGYDAIIFSDVPAHEIGDSRLTAVRDYVEKLGGGFIMIGGPNSFGPGGYHGTAAAELLPVRLRGADHEEDFSSALALVLDRSGSMSGEKLEICKSAAIATAGLLDDEDYLGVYAFDSNVHTVLPMARLDAAGNVAGQISLLSSRGGTNIDPGMRTARQALASVKAKVKHMIVLTDGETSGEGYAQLASQCHAEGITISAVAVGSGAQVDLLEAIAAAGGGQFYLTLDPSAITRIFTQDTMMHTGRLIREEPFQAELGEVHPMVDGWRQAGAPPLLGYVRTNAKSTAQVPLRTASGDPLLAHWRFGLGKVTAFTSDCKSRWAALWVNGWDGYSRLWSQVLRQTARPPQGGNMDVRLVSRDGRMAIVTDLLADAGTRLNDADVAADIYFVPANSLGAGMKPVARREFEQIGPGLYRAHFSPGNPGVYLVRVRSGAHITSVGFVHRPSAESASGGIGRDLLVQAAAHSGGQILDDPGDALVLGGTGATHRLELWPYLLLLFLALLMADVVTRRWDNARDAWLRLVRSEPDRSRPSM